jgi:hypothetical protein
LGWAWSEIGLQTLGVRVRSDNSALDFYRKVGFVEVRRTPLRRLDKADMVQWVEDESLPPGEPSLIHMANLHAAIGLAQLAKIERIAASRRDACRYYNENLRTIAEVIVPKTDFAGITPFLYYIRVPAEKRDPLRAFLDERGIDTGIHWQPDHWFTLFRNCRRGDLSVTDRVGREILSLPLHSMMTTNTLDRIISGIRSFFGIFS